jgi:hypothetical protein
VLIGGLVLIGVLTLLAWTWIRSPAVAVRGGAPFDQVLESTEVLAGLKDLPASLDGFGSGKPGGPV